MQVRGGRLRRRRRGGSGGALVVAGFSKVESRGMGWRDGEERKGDAFGALEAGEGPDIYKVTVAAIEGIPIEEVTGAQRQIGKVSELACSFGGGVGALQKMARTHGVTFTDGRAEGIKRGWRVRSPKTVKYWGALENAAITAVMNPGKTRSVGPQGRRVDFKVKGSFLWCRLPSDRVLCYPYPSIKPKETPWGEMKDQLHYMVVDSVTRKWVETSTYGGKLAENVTQAICRDLLAYSMRQAEDAGYPIVLHAHDESVVELPESFGTLEVFETCCSRTPAWAEGLPVVAKGWIGRRYRK